MFKQEEQIWIFFVFHKDQNTKKTKIKPPKYQGEGKLGVFATWSPHRINPIGLSKGRVVEVWEDGIVVDEIDLVDGTPILDLKKFDASDMPWTEI